MTKRAKRCRHPKREYYRLWRVVLVWFGWNMSVRPQFFMSCFDLPMGGRTWAHIHCVGVMLGPLDLKLVLHEP